MKSFIIYSLIFFTLSIQMSFGTTPKQRQKQIQKIVELTQEHICNPHFLTTSEWQEFLQEMNAPEVLTMTDQEFAKHFNRARKKLSFSHYYLNYSGKEAAAKRSSKASINLEAINENTALLTITTWNRDRSQIINAITTIQQEGYTNLIIDLRNNHGGTLDGAVVLGQFLTRESIDAGVYITRKWFDQTSAYPTLEEIKAFPMIKDMSYNGFYKMMSQPAFRMVIPAHNRPIFKGNLMVLTNRYTASTNEPLVHLIKQNKLGTLIGEVTNGAMMSGRYVKISKNLKLFLPVADYITANAQRIDQVGVSPDIEVASDQALERALKMLQ